MQKIFSPRNTAPRRGTRSTRQSQATASRRTEKKRPIGAPGGRARADVRGAWVFHRVIRQSRFSLRLVGVQGHHGLRSRETQSNTLQSRVSLCLVHSLWPSPAKRKRGAVAKDPGRQSSGDTIRQRGRGPSPSHIPGGTNQFARPTESAPKHGRDEHPQCGRRVVREGSVEHTKTVTGESPPSSAEAAPAPEGRGPAP